MDEAQGMVIGMENGVRVVPAAPVIPYIEGDGIGAEIWAAARPVLNAAVQRAYSGQRKLIWKEIYAGQKAFERTGAWLPDETLEALRTYRVAMKGPLATPVGGGMRSLNVALRKELDLYICQRPVRWFQGVPSPVCRPDLLNVVVFRENTEDLYAGIEFASGTPENRRFLELLQQNFPAEYARIRFPESSGIGLKPVSAEGSRRLVRAAISFALKHRRKSVTLIHKGNIMKYTEGAFRAWGYETAEQEFGAQVYTWAAWERRKVTDGEEAANTELAAACQAGRLLVKDVITDAFFEQVLTHPADFDVLATTNLNGDYLSDALAAQVGGLGIAPGANLNEESGVAVFEATHGTAPKIAGKNIANPTSLLLSGEMMLRTLGWGEAADCLLAAIETVITARTLTPDLANSMEGATSLSTSAYGEALVKALGNY